jgi:hypothetical protein
MRSKVSVGFVIAALDVYIRYWWTDFDEISCGRPDIRNYSKHILIFYYTWNQIVWSDNDVSIIRATLRMRWMSFNLINLSSPMLSASTNLMIREWLRGL